MPSALRWVLQKPNGPFSCLFKENHTGRKTRNSTFKLGYSWPLLNPGKESWFFITIHLTDFPVEWTSLFIKTLGKQSWVTQVIKWCYLMSEKWIPFQYTFGHLCVFFHWVLFCENWFKGKEKVGLPHSVLLQQCLPFCSVGKRNKMDKLHRRKWNAFGSASPFQESPAAPLAQNIPVLQPTERYFIVS